MRKTTSNESDARYRGLLEAAPDAMVVVNAEGEIVLLNVQAENRFGYRRDELVGRKITTIIPQGFAERLLADGTRSAAEALAQQIGTGIELSALRKDGSEFPIEIMLSPLESADGILVTAAIRDITVRRVAEQHLVQMEARYRGLLEAAPDAMVVVDEDGGIVLVNAQADKQFGYRRDELLGQKVTNIIPHGFAERLIADAQRSAKDALAQHIGTGIELSALRKDGSEFPIEIMLSPLTNPDEMLVTAAIRDISARKQAEVLLQLKIAELSRSNEELAHFELHVAPDGVEAIEFLRREGNYKDAPRPDLILLDLNLPRMDGREVLALVKADDTLKSIPTVILTTSEAEADIVKSYHLQANCYLSKPVQLDVFEGLVKSINDFWLTRAKLPQHWQVT
jgi:PAS domain S-box-containing protein